MTQFNFVSFVIFIYLLISQPSMIECRPRTQRIVIHGHEWTVSNEPGWEDVLREAESVRHQFLSSCATIRECRLATEKLRQVFLKHPVSSRYFDDPLEDDSPGSELPSILNGDNPFHALAILRNRYEEKKDRNLQHFNLVIYHNNK